MIDDNKFVIYNLPSLVIEPVNIEELGGFCPYILKKLDNGDIKVFSLNEEIINESNKDVLDDATSYAYFCPVSYRSGMMVDDRSVFACITDEENRIVAYEIINGGDYSLEDYVNKKDFELAIKRC